MHLLSSIGFTIIGYFILLYITTNLTGMVVRGFFCRDTDFEDLIKTGGARPHAQMEISLGDTKDKFTTVLFFIITILFLYFLYRHLNIWAAVSALLLISSRIPDLLWEIRNGRKVTMGDTPKGRIHSITGIMMLIAPLALWWSLYNL